MFRNLTIVTILFYVAWVAAESLVLFSKQQRRTRWLMFGALITLLCHAFLLTQLISTQAGHNLALNNMFSLCCWLMCTLLFVGSVQREVAVLQLATIPLSIISLFTLLIWPNQAFLLTDASWIEAVHIICAIMAFCLFGVGGTQALLLSLQHKLLKRKWPQTALMLPPIETMERVLFYGLSLGFIFLTVSLIFGFMPLPSIEARVFIEKVAFACLAWVIFAVLLFGRYCFAWRGQRAISGTLLGFFLLVVSYFGTRLLLVFVYTKPMME